MFTWPKGSKYRVLVEYRTGVVNGSLVTIQRRKMNKNEAIIKVLRVLRSQSAAVNKPNREETLTLAEEHGITAKELIDTWVEICRNI